MFPQRDSEQPAYRVGGMRAARVCVGMWLLGIYVCLSHISMWPVCMSVYVHVACSSVLPGTCACLRRPSGSTLTPQARPVLPHIGRLTWLLAEQRPPCAV